MEPQMAHVLEIWPIINHSDLTHVWNEGDSTAKFSFAPFTKSKNATLIQLDSTTPPLNPNLPIEMY